jgi:hypothetical protein
VRSRMEGLESWKPAAPGMGMKRLSIAKREVLELPHHPLRRGMNCFSTTPDEEVIVVTVELRS